MIRIVLADDHAIVRRGFRALIEQEPDVLALDLSMPGGGLALVPELRATVPELKLLVLSMHDREPYIGEALRRGVHGYVTKGAATDELVTALRAVCEGRIYLSSDLGKTAFPQSGPGRLSEREREVFLLLAKGATPKQVAVALDIGISTAYLHRSAVREKLGARNDLDLHRIALERGLV